MTDSHRKTLSTQEALAYIGYRSKQSIYTKLTPAKAYGGGQPTQWAIEDLDRLIAEDPNAAKRIARYNREVQA